MCKGVEWKANMGACECGHRGQVPHTVMCCVTCHNKKMLLVWLSGYYYNKTLARGTIFVLESSRQLSSLLLSPVLYPSSPRRERRRTYVCSSILVVIGLFFKNRQRFLSFGRNKPLTTMEGFERWKCRSEARGGCQKPKTLSRKGKLQAKSRFSRTPIGIRRSRSVI